ncbi:MAG: hypothetical protein ACJ76G_12065 [Solirubrobacterales bacterium]
MLRASSVAAVLGVVILALPAGAHAALPADTFDADGQVHANRCVRAAAPSIPLRYLGATPTGFAMTDALERFDDASCPDGTVRLDLHEVVDSPAGPLVFERGGNGYVDDQNAKYGQVALADLADPVGDPMPSGGGRGDPCPLVEGSRYAAEIASIPTAMHYKRPQDVPSGNNRGATFMHYGDPAADQGDRHDIHYSYLLWSFLDARGGGHVRALLHEGQVVEPCDVEPIRMDAFDTAGSVDGSVLARYVRTDEGGTPLYGWMVWEHDAYDGAGTIPHARWLGGPQVSTDPALAVSPPVSRPPPPPPPPAAPPPVATQAAAPPPAPPLPAPLPMRAVADVAKTLVVRGGRVRVPIGCTGTAATHCGGTVRLDAVLPRNANAARFSTLARRRYSVPAGGHVGVTLRIRKRLPRGRALRARLLVGATTRSVVLRVR